jgi:sulfate adenylyltransferase subunit 2
MTNRLSPHLRRLEARSISIMREVVAEFSNPVLLYSAGKDSSALLRLALKAFAPSKPPFPLLHIASTWDFQDVIRHRDMIAGRHELKLVVHVNDEAIARGVNPFTTDSPEYTRLMLTESLKQALTKYGFDAAFGGARRDEEKSRAKERVFSIRSATHSWEPRQQRPEIWNLYNTRLTQGQSMRVFPLSDWTELDVWDYIHSEDIPIVPLYFAKPRPIVSRGSALIMVDDERMCLLPDEAPQIRTVRFRTLGCYPLSGAIDSTATTVPDIIAETLASVASERQGRLIDTDQTASMERKKREGYF